VKRGGKVSRKQEKKRSEKGLKIAGVQTPEESQGGLEMR
jgi:hypothetical protein